MLVAEGIVAGLVGLLPFLVESHGHARVTVHEHIVVCGFLHFERCFLSGQSVGIEELVDGLTRHAHCVFKSTRVVVQNDAAGSVGTIDFHENILLVLPSLSVEIEKFLEVGIEVMLSASDQSFSRIDTHFEMALGVGLQAVILHIRSLIEADAHQQSACGAFGDASPVLGTFHVVNVGQVLLGECQVVIALLDDLFSCRSRHFDIGVAGRVESLEDKRHVAIFPHEVEEVVGAEESCLSNPPVFLCVEQRGILPFCDDIVAYGYFLVRLCPLIAGGRHTPVAARNRVGRRSYHIVGSRVV